MEEHRGHHTVTAKAERSEKQRELKEEQRRSQQRIQEKQKKVEELKQAVSDIKSRTQTAVKDSEKIFNELISSVEKRRSDVTKLIQDQEKAELNQADRLLHQVEQEIADLQRKIAELQRLLEIPDHIHFLQSCTSTRAASESEDSVCISVKLNFSFDGVIKSLSRLKSQVEELCEEDLKQITIQAAAVQIILPLEPKSREDFLYYSRQLTLDPNTVHPHLILSENNREVRYSERIQSYPNHPERFNFWEQVLCEESVCGRCYWEVEWSGNVEISVSYEEISRKGRRKDSGFGLNPQSWSLCCFSSSLFLYHNSIRTDLEVPPCSRIGVYVDHSAGTLSFYSISNTMKLLHRVQTTFTQPLYAGFWCLNGTVRLNSE